MNRKETIDAILNPISHLGATDPVTATDLRRVVDVMVNGPAIETEPAVEDGSGATEEEAKDAVEEYLDSESDISVDDNIVISVDGVSSELVEDSETESSTEDAPDSDENDVQERYLGGEET